MKVKAVITKKLIFCSKLLSTKLTKTNSENLFSLTLNLKYNEKTNTKKHTVRPPHSRRTDRK